MLPQKSANEVKNMIVEKGLLFASMISGHMRPVKTTMRDKKALREAKKMYAT